MLWFLSWQGERGWGVLDVHIWKWRDVYRMNVN